MPTSSEARHPIGVVAERMAKSALEPIGDTPAEFAGYLKSEAHKWGKLVQAAGIRAE